MKKQLTLLIVILTILIPSLNQCGSKTETNVQYFSKRKPCPKKKNFQYYSALNQHEKDLKNYFKIHHINNTKVEAAYKKADYPVGTWFYTNSDNKIVKEVSYKNGKIQEEYSYEYDQNGNKKSFTHLRYYYKDNNKIEKTLILKTLFFYKLNKDLNKYLHIKTENYNKGILDEVVELEYDPKGRLTKKSFYVFEKILKSYTLYSYDSKDRVIKEEIYDKENKKIEEIKLSYNGNGLVEKKEYSDFKTKSNTPRLIKINEYEYDQNGNLINEIEKDPNQKTIQEIHTTYDEEQCIEVRKFYNENGELIDTKKY